MISRCCLPAALAFSCSAPATAQIGGFVLARGGMTEGSKAASTGYGAIDTSGTSSEFALFVEGKLEGFEWRVRAQVAGRTEDFPGKPGVRINSLSYRHKLTDRLQVSVGKQQRVWGSGLSYQPIGFFRTETDLRDPTDSEGRAEGLPLVEATWLGDLLTTEVVYSDDLASVGDRRLRQWAVRTGAQIGKIDASVLARGRRGAPAGLGASANWASNAWVAYGDAFYGPLERGRLDADRPLSIVAGVEHPSGTLPKEERARRVNAVVGLTFTPSAPWALSAEWQHRGNGLTAHRWRGLVDTVTAAAERLRTSDAGAAYRDILLYLPLLSGGAARRDYVFGRVAFSKSLFSAALNGTVGVADGSAIITATSSYALSPLLTVSLAATRFMGNDREEFGLSPVSQIVSVSLRRSVDFKLRRD